MSDAKPSFKALFEEYAATWDTKDLSSVEPYLSPNVQMHVKGQQVSLGPDPILKKFFTDRWALPDSKVEFLKVEEVEDGVKVKLIDKQKKKVVTARDTFANENGKWVLVKHEVTDVVDWTPNS